MPSRVLGVGCESDDRKGFVGVGLNRCLKLSIGEMKIRRDMEGLINA